MENPLRRLPNQMIAVQLLIWATLWFCGAVVGLWVMEQELWRAFWFMNGMWCAVNCAIAIFGLLGSIPEPGRLRRILWFNAALDILYIAVGAYLATRSSAMLAGFGYAIIVQGAFLLVFDTWHARRVGQRSDPVEDR